MSLKAKLVSSVAAFCLVLALLVVGILAVPSATINMGGSISFQATDVNATVNITVTGTDEEKQPSKSYTFNADTDTQPEAWTGLNWNFGEGREITITIVVTNVDTVRQLDVDFTAPADMAASNVTVSTTGEDTTLDANSDSVRYTITFKPANENLAVKAAAWTASLVLSNHTGA